MSYWKTPHEYYKYALGKSIDVDNYPRQKYQCFDTFADFNNKNKHNVNLLCSITGYAGDLYKRRYEKGYDKYFEFFYPRHAERGDWIFWNQHVAMVWEVDLANDKVLCLGQNQGGAPYVNLKWYKLSTALGCMRWKGWIATEGWTKEGKHWCFYRNGKKVTGWQELEWSKGKDWFIFSKDGVMLTGWQFLKWSGGQSWFYFNSSGAMLKGIHKLDWMGKEDTYYFDPQTGAMQTGIITMKLVFDKNGCLIGGTKV